MVNCPLRIAPFYDYIKRQFIVKNKPISFSYSGGEWVGLGCNTIHYLDVLAFLAEDKLAEVVVSELDNVISTSKRDGFIEFTGTLHCKFDRGSSLKFTSVKGSKKDPTIVISQETAK